MEPRSQGKRAQGTLGFRSSKKLLQQQQKGLTGDGKKRHSRAELKGSAQQSWPPAHGSKPSEKRVKEKLPEKLMLLEEMYQSMEAAISLLRIRRSTCTFSTIAAAVESSTQRRFLRSHLAQMKHILPEALQVEEHISWDAESQCSLRDLRITLLSISSEEGGSVQRYKSPQKSTDMVVRRREFHSRLLEFHQKNKEIDIDVPQALMFDGVASSCLGVGNVKLPEPSCTNLEDLQDGREECQTNKQVKASQLNSEQGLNKNNECDMSPLPVAFHISQLKKYPRSPSKLPHQHRISPAPLHASLSHLPPVFKPHFSAKRQTDLADQNTNKSSEKAPELVSGLGSIAAVKPHFSFKRCKKTDVPTVPCTPQKMLTRATTPEKCLADCHARTSPLPAAATQTSSLMSPPAGWSTMHEPKCRTPTQSDCTIPSNFTSPASMIRTSTPQQAILTPSVATTPSVASQNKEAEVVPPNRRKQAVIKSLRFGTPTKRGGHDKTLPNSKNVKEATVTAFSDSFMSPVKTPGNDSFVVLKKPAGNVSRVLPFNSPVGAKNKVSPQFGSCEDRLLTPKRVKLSSQQLSELEPSSIKQDLTEAGNMCLPTDNLEMAAIAGQSHEANFVELNSMSGADRLSASDVEILKCLPQELLNDVQAKERKQLHDVQCGLEQARRRQQLIAGLPKLFNMVRLLFQSGNRTVLTRKDLVKMVLSSHPDIADQGEIMEQLQLLVDFAPEWISMNRSLAGDLLYRINKNANMRAVSKALVEAK